MMNIAKPRDTVEAVRAQFPAGLVEVKEAFGETTLIVTPAALESIMRYLRDTHGLAYNFLSDISAVDYYPEMTRPERFGVSYHLYSMLYNRRLRVKTFVAEDDPLLPTMTTVWPAANWLEREIYDMMGIVFEGHPNMKRVLMPDDWNGHPHRKDYPLGYETIMFSFNADEVAKSKPRAQE
jgi:NADH-quinone oxidoreductase subunit C